MANMCNVCGLPSELCICQEIAKEQQRAFISTARRRYGKIVTIVEVIDDVAPIVEILEDGDHTNDEKPTQC